MLSPMGVDSPLDNVSETNHSIGKKPEHLSPHKFVTREVKPAQAETSKETKSKSFRRKNRFLVIDGPSSPTDLKTISIDEKTNLQTNPESKQLHPIPLHEPRFDIETQTNMISKYSFYTSFDTVPVDRLTGMKGISNFRFQTNFATVENNIDDISAQKNLSVVQTDSSSSKNIVRKQQGKEPTR